MKLFILLAATFAITVAEWTAPTKEEYVKAREACFKSENVPEAIVEKINKRQYDQDLGNEGRCFFKCTAIATGTWDDTNGYNLDRSLKLLETMGLNFDVENAKKCMKPNTDNVDSCTWAFSNYVCLWNNKYVTKKE